MNPPVSGWHSSLAIVVGRLRDRVLIDQPGTSAAIAAQATGGLPLYCDIGGCIVLTVQGQLLSYLSEEEQIVPLRETGWRTLALVLASEQAPEFRVLRPPPLATRCPQCGGIGRVPPSNSWCSSCSGLGTV